MLIKRIQSEASIHLAVTLMITGASELILVLTSPFLFLLAFTIAGVLLPVHLIYVGKQKKLSELLQASLLCFFLVAIIKSIFISTVFLQVSSLLIWVHTISLTVFVFASLLTSWILIKIRNGAN